MTLRILSDDYEYFSTFVIHQTVLMQIAEIQHQLMGQPTVQLLQSMAQLSRSLVIQAIA